MSVSTNSLVAMTEWFGVPAGAAATVLLGLTLGFGHNSAHAAASAAAPLDNNSVAPLVSLAAAVAAVPRRNLEAADHRDARADPREAGTQGASRLRIRTQWRRQSVHGVRAAGRVARSRRS